jgi:elongation factor G
MSPSERHRRGPPRRHQDQPKSKAEATHGPDPKAPLSALVFKTVSDPHVGKLTFFRVYSGTLRADGQAYNATRQARERVGHIGWLQGKTQKPVETLGPGEIGVVSSRTR